MYNDYEDEEEEENVDEQKQQKSSSSNSGSSRNPIQNAAQNRSNKKNAKAQRQEKKAAKQTNKAEKQAQKSQKFAQNGNAKKAQKAGNKSKKAAEKAKKFKEKAEKAKKAADKAQKVAKVAAKIGRIAATVGWIIVIVLMVIGIIVFVLMGLGMIWDGLKKVFDGIGDGLTGLIQGDQYIVEKQDLQEIVDYISELGYDLYGYGFVANQFLEDDQDHPAYAEVKTDDTDNDNKSYIIFPKEGIADDKNIFNQFHMSSKTDSDGNSTYIQDRATNSPKIAAYKHLLAYIVSDNYSKILKNDNKSLSGWFDNTQGWGSGLINVKMQDGDDIGAASGNMHKWNRGDAEVNGGYLVITSRSRGVVEKYNLDGWIGRYGMPMEFLLSTHIATLAPDLCFKLATSFDTEVEVVLAIVEQNTMEAGIRIDGSDNQILTLNDISDLNEGLLADIGSIVRNIWEAGGDALDNWSFDREEAMKVFVYAKQNGINLDSQTDENSAYQCKGPDAEKETIYENDKASLSAFRGKAEDYNGSDDDYDTKSEDSSYEWTEGANVGKNYDKDENGKISTQEYKEFIKNRVRTYIFDEDNSYRQGIKDTDSDAENALQTISEEKMEQIRENVASAVDSFNIGKNADEPFHIDGSEGYGDYYVTVVKEVKRSDGSVSDLGLYMRNR